MSSSQRVASSPASSASSRRAVASGSSPSWSRVPAGISSTRASTAARYWRTSVTVPSSWTGTTVTAPGWRMTKRSKGSSVGVEEVQAVHPEQPGPEELLLRDTAEARHGPR